MADIVVVGSLNMDLSVKVTRRPLKGETVLGSAFLASPGGKGANQAFAAGRLGASVAMIGKVGDDAFGGQLLSRLGEAGVDVSGIAAVAGVPTGIAAIQVDPEGDNSIVVAPGANETLVPADVRAHERLIAEAKLLMIQLEIPLDTVLEAASLASKHRVPVLLDPAPARELPAELLALVDYIVPNESEIAELTGIAVSDTASAIQAANDLMSRGVATVFSKLGANGVVVIRKDETFTVAGYPVVPVDTTAAGDAFAGALATALVSGRSLKEAARFANAVGALAVTKPGAQSAMPDLAEAERFMKEAAQAAESSNPSNPS